MRFCDWLILMFSVQHERSVEYAQPVAEFQNYQLHGLAQDGKRVPIHPTKRLLRWRPTFGASHKRSISDVPQLALEFNFIVGCESAFLLHKMQNLGFDKNQRHFVLAVARASL